MSYHLFTRECFFISVPLLTASIVSVAPCSSSTFSFFFSPYAFVCSVKIVHILSSNISLKNSSGLLIPGVRNSRWEPRKGCILGGPGSGYGVLCQPSATSFGYMVSFSQMTGCMGISFSSGIVAVSFSTTRSSPLSLNPVSESTSTGKSMLLFLKIISPIFLSIIGLLSISSVSLLSELASNVSGEGWPMSNNIGSSSE